MASVNRARVTRDVTLAVRNTIFTVTFGTVENGMGSAPLFEDILKVHLKKNAKLGNGYQAKNGVNVFGKLS